jgi:prepilin-type N-terminal cleavage/methylation domain-containing protein
MKRTHERRTHERRTHERRTHEPNAREGMTLLELMVAVMLLGVGILGLAGFTLVTGKQLRGSGYQENAALVVQSRLDSLASIRCQALAPSGPQTGTALTLGVLEKWVVSDGNDIKTISDTVRFTGRTRPLIYNSIIPCRD